MECPVQIVMRLEPTEGVLLVLSVTEQEEHNHEISEKIAAFYPENRKLDEKEKNVVKELLAKRVAPRTIASTLNATRGAESKIGTVIVKDIFNRATVLKKEGRGERSEEQVLQQFLQKRKKEDPEGSYSVAVHGESSELTVLFIQSGEMKRTFARNSEVVFIDSTYR